MAHKSPPKPPQNPQFTADLLALMDRHRLTEPGAAALLGVPVYTLKKWVSGERGPGAATIRLLEVLGIVEAMAPSLFGVLAPEIGHVEKLSSTESIGQDEKLVMSKNWVSNDQSAMSKNPVSGGQS
jgi:hypothetical protein